VTWPTWSVCADKPLSALRLLTLPPSWCPDSAADLAAVGRHAHRLPAWLVSSTAGRLHDLVVTVGPAADGMTLSSRRRLLRQLRACDVDSAAREMEHHLRGLHFMGRLACGAR